jgi:hypothetical protein
MDIGCYQGLRHRRGRPVHGLRTHTNARTRTGPRTTGANTTPVTKYGRRPRPEVVDPARRSARTSPTALRTSRVPSTTRLSPSPTRGGTPWHGLQPAMSASRAPASRPRLQLRWPPSSAPVGPWSTASVRSTWWYVVLAPVARPPSGPSRTLVSR